MAADLPGLSAVDALLHWHSGQEARSFDKQGHVTL
jgi:hypothetical protein